MKHIIICQINIDSLKVSGKESYINGEFIPIFSDILKALAKEKINAATLRVLLYILAIADTFDVPEAVEGIFKWDVSDIFYNYYFVGNYVSVGGDTGDDRSILNIYNMEAVQCLDVYKALNQFFYIESDTVSYESVLQDFIDGKIVFTIVTTDAAAKLSQAKEDGSFVFEYGAATIPDPSEKLVGHSLSVTNTVAVNGYSENKELANKFAAYLVGEYAGNLYERANKCPVNYNVIHTDKLLDVFYQEYEHSIALPKIMETSNYWMEMEVAFSKVWNGADTNEILIEMEKQIQTQILGKAE